MKKSVYLSDPSKRADYSKAFKMVIDAFAEAAAYCIPLLKTCESSPVEHRFTSKEQLGQQNVE